LKSLFAFSKGSYDWIKNPAERSGSIKWDCHFTNEDISEQSSINEAEIKTILLKNLFLLKINFKITEFLLKINPREGPKRQPGATNV